MLKKYSGMSVLVSGKVLILMEQKLYKSKIKQ
jgi:hypothetical protein